MVKEELKQSENRMNGVIDATKHEFASIRTGRANPSLLDRVMVDYYGTPTPLNQLASLSTPDARTILIQPWDKSALGAMEKAILKSDLGLMPNNDGSVIRLNIPHLTEERRKELVKVVKRIAEEMRVAIRNIRRDSNDAIKKMEKDKIISEDDMKKGLDDIQKLTDTFIMKIDGLLEEKEKEIMEV